MEKQAQLYTRIVAKDGTVSFEPVRDASLLCPVCKVNDKPNKLRKSCEPCRIARDAANKAANNKRQLLARERKPNPCRCGCGKEAIHPAKYAEECREAAQKAIYEAQLQRARDNFSAKSADRKVRRAAERQKVKDEVAHSEESMLQVEQFKPWVRKPKPKPILTDAEQRAINAAVDRARLTQCGLAKKDEGRRLSAEEIEALKHKITPIHLIPKFHGLDNCWAGYL